MQAFSFSKLTRVRASRWAAPFGLILILGLAWGLRLYHLGAMSIWWDESLSWDRAINTLPNILSNTIMIQNVATRDLHPPLYFLLLHFSVLAAGTTEFALRFLSAFANVLTLALVYPLTLLLTKNKGVALLAVCLAALSPFYVWYAQEARPYALVLLWSTLAVYALLRWLKTEPYTWRALWSRWGIVFGLAFLLTLATHYLSFVLLPLFAAMLLLFGKPARTWRERFTAPLTWLALGMLGGFALILFLLPRDAQDLASWDQVGANFVPLFIMLRDVWNSFTIGLTAKLDQFIWLDLFLVALWCVGVFSTVRVAPRLWRVACFLFAYLLVPALALHVGSYLRPLYLNSRHLITTSPAFYIGLAIGAHALARRAERVRNVRAWRPAAALVYTGVLVGLLAPVVFGMGTSLRNLYFDTTYAKDDHKGWAQFLRERLRPDDYLLLVAPQAEKIVRYYAPAGLQWESLPHLGQTQDWQIVLDRESVLNAYRNHKRVWLLEIHQPVGDPKFVINKLLQRFGESVDYVYFPGISSRTLLQQFVYRGPTRPKEFTPPNALELSYDDNLKLTGYDAPRQIEPGVPSVVDLYWRLNRKSPNNVSVSLRVTDDAGRVWGQWDAPPVGNAFPISKWESKTTYADQHALSVDAGTPPGRYNLEMRVYREGGNEPLSATRLDTAQTMDSFVLGSLDVMRPAMPRDPSTLVVDQHADVLFGDSVRFVGYDLDDRVSPGNAAPLTLYFQVLKNAASDVTGQVELAAPCWQFWNRARASVPFTLELQNRHAGDIVQANLGARVPGDADAGAYALTLALDALKPNAPLVWGDRLPFAEVQVQALDRSTAMPGIANPVNARLGDSVEFLGYDWNTPAQLRPGDTVKMTLHWRALKPMDTSYKVFTHLINAQNEIFGQQDKEPLDGARPTQSWAAGEIFSDVYEFQVAANAKPGDYQIEIGMYAPSDFTRLPTFDARGNPLGDRILFGELRIP